MSGLLLGISCTFRAHHKNPQLAPEDIARGKKRVPVCTWLQTLLSKKGTITHQPTQTATFFHGRDLHIKKRLGVFAAHFSVFIKWKKNPLILPAMISCEPYILHVCIILSSKGQVITYFIQI